MSSNLYVETASRTLILFRSSFVSSIASSEARGWTVIAQTITSSEARVKEVLIGPPIASSEARGQEEMTGPPIASSEARG